MSESTDNNWLSKVESQLLGKKFLHIYHILARIICIATLAVQIGFLDYYLIYFNDLLWLLWLIADVIVLVLFLVTVIHSYKHLEKRPIKASDQRYIGELPLTYISWFVYSIVLSAKVCFLYALPDSIVLRLDEKYFFGPNMLRTSISLASIVVYVLVLTSHDARSHSKQNTFIQSIVGSVYLDVLDTSEFLGTMRDESLVIQQYHLDRVILAFTCINFVLPTEGLYMLARNHFGKIPVSLKFQFIHKVIYYVVVNLPFFVIRLVIWHLHDKHISVFLVKNVLGLGLAVQHLHEVLLEVSHVITSDVHTGDDATASPERGGHQSIEMQQLTTAAEPKESKSGETFQSVEILSPRV